MNLKHNPTRWRKFAEAYSRTGNGRAAAVEAGYSESSAHVTASKLLRRQQIQTLIRAREIRRDVHAQKTYENLCNMTSAAVSLYVATLKDPNADLHDKIMAQEGARRMLETMARADGLFMGIDLSEGRGGGSVVLNLQQLVQIFNTNYADAGKPAGAMLEAAKEGGGLSSPPIPAEWKSIDESGGNGHAKGNGDQSAAKPPDAA